MNQSRCAFSRLSIVLCLLVTAPLYAAEHWIKLTTPHFEMYTTNSEKQATEALNIFEQVRAFFLQSSNSNPTAEARVRIIAFRGEKDYKPYRLNEGAFAYYIRSRKADFIVMQDISQEHYPAAMHEYTHLVVEHAELKLPIWLNEGLADVYSSLEPRGNQAMVGRPLPGRSDMLTQQKWMDLNALFEVGHDSPYYNEKEKMSIFYAESWALTHMLTLSNEYKSSFSKFMAAIAAGQPAAECFQSIYGKSTAQVTRDLHSYVNRSTLNAAIFDIKLSKSELEPEVSEPSELAVNLALADLLATQKRNNEEVSQRLTKLAADHPEDVDVQESLGYLAWSQGNAEKARDCFKFAFDHGTKNAEMLNHYASLLHESGASPQQILPVLQRAVELSPDDQIAWLNLASTTVAAGQYGVALSELTHVKKVKAEQAYAVFSMQAYCYLRLKAPQQARDLANRAQKYAKTPDQQSQISNLLRGIDSLEHPNAATPPAPVEEVPCTAPLPITKRVLSLDEPTVHLPGLLLVEAVVKFFDCTPKVHRLRVTVDSREMSFELANPESIIVRNGTDGHVDMNCGPQKPFNLGIFYMPSNPPSPADGTIRELVF